MSTRRTRQERDALRELGWKLSLDKYQPPELDLFAIKDPGDASRTVLLDAGREGSAYLKSNLSRDIENCR